MQIADQLAIADAIVNILGAAGVAIVAVEAWRTDPRGAVTRRVVGALALVGLLFVVRGLAYGTGSWLLDELSVLLAAAVPLAALIVAEGLLRRHAPRPLKLAIALGLVAVVVATAIPRLPADWRNALLFALHLGGFGAVVWLLWRREVASLSLAENQVIRRIAIALLLLPPAIITDFRFLLPEVPVRMGAFGALLVLYLGFGVGGGATTRTRLVTQIVFLCVATILASAFIATSPSPSFGSVVRATVVACSGLVVAALISESLGARAERARTSDPLLLAGSSAAFEAVLGRHHLLAGSTILSDADLAHLRHPAFDALIGERPVLRLKDAPWSRAPTDDGVERARSMLTAYDATHALRLDRDPLRLLLVALPGVSADQRTEGELEIAQHVSELLHGMERAR